MNQLYYCIFTKKLNLYGVKRNNVRWFESYLSNRKQYINYNGNKCTTFESITYGAHKDQYLDLL